MHTLWSIYILADRFLRNSGLLVKREVSSNVLCQFPSERSFEKSKNTEVSLNLTLKIVALRCFFAIKDQPSAMHNMWSINIG